MCIYAHVFLFCIDFIASWSYRASKLVHGVRARMATNHIPTVEKFNFSQPDEWAKWLRRFERFYQASGIDSKSKESQVNALVYSMGNKTGDILLSFRLSEEDQKKYETVTEQFTKYFVKHRNPIFERVKFNRRKQKEGKLVDSFITDLFCLAEHCRYGAVHNKTVRDQIVVGILNSSLSERMQLDPELTLKKLLILHIKARLSRSSRQQCVETNVISRPLKPLGSEKAIRNCGSGSSSQSPNFKFVQDVGSHHHTR